MARVCESKLLSRANIDGHALCPYWDFCKERLTKDEVAKCETRGSDIYKTIARYIDNIHLYYTIDEIIDND